MTNAHSQLGELDEALAAARRLSAGGAAAQRVTLLAAGTVTLTVHGTLLSTPSTTYDATL